MAAKHEAYDVFLSHAGEQKKVIVDSIYTLLRLLTGVRVFLDELSLVPGDDGWDTIVDAAERARVAVVVLTREFASKKAPMEELRTFLRRHADSNDKLVIVPVLPEDEWERFDRIDQLYEENDEPSRGWPKGKRPTDSTRKEWAALIKELVGLTCIRGDQTAYYQGQLASRAVDVVVRRLVELGRLPVGFTWETHDKRCFQYTVQVGDTFAELAQRLGVSVDVLLKLNPGVVPQLVQIGQVVSLPGPIEAPSRRLYHDYVVKAGDTFATLAQHLGVSMEAVLKLNPGVVPELVQIGQVVRLPGPIEAPSRCLTCDYVIKAGDTFAMLAQRLGVPVDALLELNPRAVPEKLQIGQVVCLPGSLD